DRGGVGGVVVDGGVVVERANEHAQRLTLRQHLAGLGLQLVHAEFRHVAPLLHVLATDSTVLWIPGGCTPGTKPDVRVPNQTRKHDRTVMTCDRGGFRPSPR